MLHLVDNEVCVVLLVATATVVVVMIRAMRGRVSESIPWHRNYHGHLGVLIRILARGACWGN